MATSQEEKDEVCRHLMELRLAVYARMEGREGIPMTEKERMYFLDLEYETAKLAEYLRLIETGEGQVEERLVDWCREWMRIYVPEQFAAAVAANAGGGGAGDGDAKKEVSAGGGGN